jgi:hypothetical protein
MSAREAYTPQRGFESDDRLRNDGRGRLKGYDVGKRTSRGCASKRTVDKPSVTSRVVVRMVRGHLDASGCGTQLQQKRRPARRHKANGHISAKQEDDQQ